MADTDDPIVASYSIFITAPATRGRSSTSSTPPSLPKTLVLQYPAYRPASRPYNAARSQKPSELRLKPNTGLVEMDVPILTHEHYNSDSGARFAKAMSESKTLHGKTSHGLAGGFHTGPGQVPSLRDVPTFQDIEVGSPELKTQTVGGKIMERSERDPIYFLGSIKDDEIHLSHLDGVVQMRPQLHHLDAEEEINQKRYQVGPTGPGVKMKAAPETGPSKLESRAIEIKLKDTKDESRDRTLNENARLLREIQIDNWRPHVWIDQDHAISQAFRTKFLTASTLKGHQHTFYQNQLRSALSNGDWLDKMSAPREDGKKGLLAKLRGRERERARRKKAEEEKKMKSKEAGSGSHHGTGPLLEQSSNSEASSADATDAEVEQDAVKDVDMQDAVEIKEEPEGVANECGTPRTATRAGMEPKPAKKKGRPKKNQTIAPIEVED